MGCWVKCDTLGELDAGFRGEMTMSQDMEKLMSDLYTGIIPTAWQVRPFAFPSLRPLGHGWVILSERITQLSEWSTSPMETPDVHGFLVCLTHNAF